MVGYQTFSNNKNIYSVDMMFAYINIFKPKSIKIPISELLKNLEGKSWGDPKKKYIIQQLLNQYLWMPQLLLLFSLNRHT